MKSKYLKIIYIALIHLLLIIVVMNTYYFKAFISYINGNSNELTKHYYQMKAFHQRIDNNLTQGYNVFIGDSLIQGLAVSEINSKSVNYGIGNDTTYGVIKRLPLYKSIFHAKNVIFSIGHNDIRQRKENDIIQNFKTIIEYIPSNKKVIICAIFLVDENIQMGEVTNLKIQKLNNKIKSLILNYSNVSYLDINLHLSLNENLSSQYHIGDGIHLNKRGNDIWIRELKNVLQRK